MYSGRDDMGKELFGVASAKVQRVYNMTLQGRLHTLHLTAQKLKVISSSLVRSGGQVRNSITEPSMSDIFDRVSLVILCVDIFAANLLKYFRSTSLSLLSSSARC